MLPLKRDSCVGVFRISDTEIGCMHRKGRGVIIDKADGTHIKPGVSVNNNAAMLLFFNLINDVVLSDNIIETHGKAL